MTKIVAGALSEAEARELTDLEQTIERGMVTFVAVGGALHTIRERKLYRAEHSTFEDYTRERWGIGASRARQLIAAADVVQSVTTVTPDAAPPANERTARALSAAPPTERAEVWQEAVETAPEGKVTAAHVQATVEKRRPKPEPEDVAPPDDAEARRQSAERAREAATELQLKDTIANLRAQLQQRDVVLNRIRRALGLPKEGDIVAAVEALVERAA